MPLFVVATPIGNLEDMSPRATRILAEAEIIACEDTRVTGKLMESLGIRAPLRRLDAHASSDAVEALAEQAVSGRVALVTDAGTPGVSDPGTALVSASRASGADVVSVAGPSALATAVAGSGLPAEPLLFLGFLPRKGRERALKLQWLRELPVTGVIYESPRRVPETLRELADTLGERSAVLARELTKRFETWDAGLLGALAERHRQAPKGEVVLVIGPADGQARPGEAEPEEEAAWVNEARRSLALGLRPSQVAKELARRSGRTRAEAYAWVMAAQRDQEQT